MAGNLSGGKQQKIVIGKWLLMLPKVLIVDEPTRGIDVGSKSEIHKLIRDLASQGYAIIVISSEMPEVLHVSDRIIAMYSGRIVRQFTSEEVTEDSLTNLSYGTAMRAISNLPQRGLIAKRARTATGKSFSLHPTTRLMEEWQELARRMQSLLGGHVVQDRAEASRNDYFFGSSYANKHVLTPPSILDAKLTLSGGLRILFHADPTFMAMHMLKKRFQSLFGVRINSNALSIDRLREEILRNARLPQSRYDTVA